MSDHRWLVLAALALGPRVAPAQDLGEWRQRLATQSARSAAAESAMRAYNRKDRDFDRRIAVGGLVVHFISSDLPASDSAAIARGLEQAIALTRERYGEAGVTLTDGGEWTATRLDRRKRGVFEMVEFERVNDRTNRAFTGSPVDPSDVVNIVLAFAGERLTRTTPGLASFNGYSALQPDRVRYAEIARRFATSWAGSVRRCAAGALDACATVLTPFDANGEPTRYFDPADFRAVVTAARLPALGDSVYFDARRRCIKGEDSVCARVIERVTLPDPLNPQVRGTLLAHAIELGGTEALARAAESTDSSALGVLVRIAGVPADSLLSSWRTRVFDALAEDRGAAGAPLLFSSALWAGLLLLVATKRRYL